MSKIICMAFVVRKNNDVIPEMFTVLGGLEFQLSFNLGVRRFNHVGQACGPKSLPCGFQQIQEILILNFNSISIAI